MVHSRGEHGADQWSGTGDGREVVLQQHILFRQYVIEAVAVVIDLGVRSEAIHCAGAIAALPEMPARTGEPGRILHCAASSKRMFFTTDVVDELGIATQLIYPWRNIKIAFGHVLD